MRRIDEEILASVEQKGNKFISFLYELMQQTEILRQGIMKIARDLVQ